MKIVRKEFQFGGHTVILETGKIARQASSVIVSVGDTIVMVNCVAKKESVDGQSFFPLTVDYQERTYAAGKIPGGFFKREGRLSEKEILTCRLIDRSLRPLFPKSFRNEVQIVATVISLDPQINPDILALIGAAASVALTGMPFNGPLGATRVGYIDGDYVLNPSVDQLVDSLLDLVVAGTGSSVLMVESSAKQLTEEIMLSAVMFGHQELQVVIENINALAKEVAVVPWDYPLEVRDQVLTDVVSSYSRELLREAYSITDKISRKERINEIYDEVVEHVTETQDTQWLVADIRAEISKLESHIVRSSILAGEKRIDGRDTKTIRPISTEVGLLPRAHGSALFTRGETQAIVVVTLGTERDSQFVDSIQGSYKEPFMLHYNFPPYCVGEVGRTGIPKRREIGHGNLAKRGIAGVMPDMDVYPYSIRVVSEITESNGSSSMASVCGTSLALMDAGVSIEVPVAGIAMGLIKEDDKFVVLSDILGDEDHLGDMDFKVAGSSNGVTALQMDIKIDGITKEIMQVALAQAKEGRAHILQEMSHTISEVRTEMSEFAPRITVIKIHPDKIRDVIGKGGSTIRSITEETGATIDIQDDGTVKIAAVDKAAGDMALQKIEQITADIEVGKIYEGKVAKLMDFGAFVTILPGKDGLVHISQISDERVENVADKLSEGDTVKVKILEVDRQGRIRLSMKAVSDD